VREEKEVVVGAEDAKRQLIQIRLMETNGEDLI
jgi:hypothetical protein